jgi:DNA end-binding protein Ku
LAAIACYENALVLYLLKYQEEIWSLSDFDIPADNLKQVKATSEEIRIAKKLIISMSAEWHPEKYKDEYASIVHKWAEKKIKKVPITKGKSSVNNKRAAKEVNFVDLLQRSLGKSNKSSNFRKSNNKIKR